MRLTFLLFLSLYVVNTFGQSNFVAASITTRKGETIKGEIDYQEWIVNPKTIRFRKGELGTIQTFKPIDLANFTIEQNQEQYLGTEMYINYEPVNGSINGYTRSREIKTFETGTDFTKIDLVKDTIFLQVLVKGKLNLYSLFDEFGKQHFFAQLEDSPIEELIYRVLKEEIDPFRLNEPREIEILDYITQLEKLMEDCPAAQRGLRQLTYSYAIMTKVVEYNICQNSLTYTKKGSKAKKAVTIMVGAALPMFRFENTFHKHNATQSGALVPAFGIGLDLGVIRTKDRASFKIETNYSEINLVHTFTPNLFDLADIYEQEVTIKGLRNTIALKYNLSAKRIMPYLFAGIGITTNFEEKHILRKIEDDALEPFAISTEDLKFPNTDLFALGGFGLVSKNYFVELRYELGSDLDRKTNQSLYSNRASLLAGYRLPFGKYK